MKIVKTTEEYSNTEKDAIKDCRDCNKTGFRKLKKVPIIEEALKGYEYV